jgi:hypothetical protein
MELELNRLYQEFKKLPDYERYPMPEVYYKHFNEKKPKPAEIQEILDAPSRSVYTAYESFEEREPLPGGVREIPELPPLEVQATIKTDDEMRIEEMQKMMSTVNVDHYQEIKKLWRGIALKEESTDQTDASHPQETQQSSSDSTESISTKNQE